jgi:hypothetical protein
MIIELLNTRFNRDLSNYIYSFYSRKFNENDCYNALLFYADVGDYESFQRVFDLFIPGTFNPPNSQNYSYHYYFNLIKIILKNHYYNLFTLIWNKYEGFDSLQNILELLFKYNCDCYYFKQFFQFKNSKNFDIILILNQHINHEKLKYTLYLFGKDIAKYICCHHKNLINYIIINRPNIFFTSKMCERIISYESHHNYTLKFENELTLFVDKRLFISKIAKSLVKCTKIIKYIFDNVDNIHNYLNLQHYLKFCKFKNCPEIIEIVENYLKFKNSI